MWTFAVLSLLYPCKFNTHSEFWTFVLRKLSSPFPLHWITVGLVCHFGTCYDITGHFICSCNVCSSGRCYRELIWAIAVAALKCMMCCFVKYLLWKINYLKHTGHTLWVIKNETIKSSCNHIVHFSYCFSQHTHHPGCCCSGTNLCFSFL